jgi:ABC-type transport system substrate-binding protein
MEEIGYRRGGSGFWEDVIGRRAAFEHWAPAGGVQGRSALVATDFWRVAGLDVTQVTLGPRVENSVRAEHPGILTSSAGGDYSAVWRYFHSSFSPVRENGYAGSNRGRYMLPDQDVLLERWYSTVPQRERTEALRHVTRYQTENAIWMGYMYNPQLSMISNRLKDVAPSSYSNKTFDAHVWDIT